MSLSVTNFIYSHPSVSAGDWFQDPPQIPKSADAEVPYINDMVLVLLYNLCDLPVYVKSSLDYIHSVIQCKKLLYCLGNNNMEKKSVLAQYRCNQHRPNYIVNISNNITFFFPPNIFHPRFIQSADVELTDMEG